MSHEIPYPDRLIAGHLPAAQLEDHNIAVPPITGVAVAELISSQQMQAGFPAIPDYRGQYYLVGYSFNAPLRPLPEIQC